MMCTAHFHYEITKCERGNWHLRDFGTFYLLCMRPLMMMIESFDILSVPQLSLLAEFGFGGVLIYVDPCDTPPGRHMGHQAPRVTLNPGGNPTDGKGYCAISLFTHCCICMEDLGFAG